MDKELVIIDHLRHFTAVNFQMGFRAFNFVILCKLWHLKFRGMTMSDTRHILEAFIKSYKSIPLFFF